MPDVPRGLSKWFLDTNHLEGLPRLLVDDGCSLAVDINVPYFPPLGAWAGASSGGSFGALAPVAI
jgi:hypothetical protein